MSSTGKRGRKSRNADFKPRDQESIQQCENNFTDLNEIIILVLPIKLSVILDYYNDQSTNVESPKLTSISKAKIKPFNSLKRSKKANNLYLNKDDNMINQITNHLLYKTNIVSKDSEPVEISVYDNKPLPTEKITLSIDNKVYIFMSRDYITLFNEIEIEKVKAQKTNIACWWCCHTFKGYPVCLPVNYNTTKSIFNVIGCFCSFNCAKSYSILYNTKNSSLLHFLAKKVLSIGFVPIKKAPCKSTLQMFGGLLSIEEYRDSFLEISDVVVNEFPMCFNNKQIEIHLKKKNTAASLDNFNVDKNNLSEVNNKAPPPAFPRKYKQILPLTIDKEHKLSLNTSKVPIKKGNTLADIMNIQVV